MLRQLLTITAALVMAAGLASAQESPTADEIVAKANHMAYYQGEDGRARVKMTITDSQSRTREKEFTILRKNMDTLDKEQRFYVYFHRPADESGTAFMVWKHVGQDDDRWLYLPALDVTKRIAASDERTSFVGSDFFYEDVSGRGVEEDTHELLSAEDPYYVIKSTPKNPGNVEFDAYTIHVHKDSFMPVKAEFEKGGQVYRVMENLGVEDVQGKKTIVKQKMSDLQTGSSTIIENTQVEYDIGLPEDVFTERYLRRAPREYLR